MMVESGAIVVLRMYDVAWGIDLQQVEAELLRHTSAEVSRFRLRRAEPKAISFDVPPLQVGLGTVPVSIGNREWTADVSFRVYDLGAISVMLRFNIENATRDEFTHWVNEIGRWAADDATELWASLRARATKLLEPAISQPSHSPLEEDYLLAIVRRMSGPVTGAGLLSEFDLAPLLSGETKPLSPSAQRDLLQHTFSYYQDDAAVLTWDRAFLYEPDGDTDVADIIEVANMQLLALRHYDERLDDELPLMNERIMRARGGLGAFARSRYRNLARDLYSRVAEITQMRERIDNALTVTEDVYLARIYAAALELFRVRVRAATIDRKLGIIRDAYTALYDEAATARAEILEAAIVALIVFEIILSFI